MKSSKKYYLWSGCLVLLTVLVSWLTTAHPSPESILISVLGHLGFSTIASSLFLALYWIVKRKITASLFMYAFTISWMALAIANLSVM